MRAIGAVLLVWLLWTYDGGGRWTPLRTYDSLEACEAADQEFKRFDPKQHPDVDPADVAKIMKMLARPRICYPPVQYPGVPPVTPEDELRL
jgi:hypothetical protein